MRAILLAVALVACGDNSSAPIDAPAIPVDGTHVDAFAGFNFYGERCTEAPYPDVTTCHPDDKGWCVAGVCRPMCSAACPAGTMQRSDRGACYCAPS